MRTHIADPSHLARILALETSAGLIMSKADETTSSKAKELEVYNNGISGYATVCLTKKEEILQIFPLCTLAQQQPRSSSALAAPAFSPTRRLSASSPADR